MKKDIKQKRKLKNKLNDLTPKEWLLFQKSWFIHNPPPRKKDVIRHPAKFPETMVAEFIQFFTKAGQTVFDPMAGTGSTLIAALRTGRHSMGIEINPEYAAIAKKLLSEEKEELGAAAQTLTAEVIQADAAGIPSLHLPPMDYMITSPPYWDMLRAAGAETQKNRREDSGLDLYYSEDSNDLGNIEDYDAFLDQLSDIYLSIQPILRASAYITIIVKNIKKGGRIYPLAWDLARRLSTTYSLKDERIWCQDNQRLFPFGMGNAWVSNTFHHYCLQFRNE